MISMLADLKVSSWACKCVFYVPEQSPKRENAGLQLQKWNIPMDRAQRIDEQTELLG